MLSQRLAFRTTPPAPHRDLLSLMIYLSSRDKLGVEACGREPSPKLETHHKDIISFQLREIISKRACRGSNLQPLIGESGERDTVINSVGSCWLQ